MKRPTQKIRGFAITALAYFLSFCGYCVENPPADKIDQFFKNWNRPDSPGAAIVIVKDAGIVFQRSYGAANLEHGIPITAQTVFDIGSVSKQFTGLAVAMLVERGKLSLDDDIRKYLPDMPDFGQVITVRHLLFHTAGIPDWPNLLVLSGTAPEEIITLGTILDLLRRQTALEFRPGDDHAYSSSGYNLLAAIIAKATGQSFRAWTDANLFRPLQMDHTHVCEDPAEVVPNRADSYVPEASNFRRMVSQLSAPGAGSVLTSTEDMGKWLINFETAKVGGKKALAMMQRSGKLNNGADVEYGFGIRVSKWSRYRGMTVLSHRGDWAGYHSFMMSIPEERFALALFSTAADLEPLGLAVQVVDLYLGNSLGQEATPESQKSPLTTSSPMKLTSKQLAAYVGDYWNDELRVLFRVEIRGDQLVTWHRLTGWARMLPTGTDSFRTDAQPPIVGSARPVSIIQFTRSANTEVNGMKLAIARGRIRNPRIFSRVSLSKAQSK